MTQKINSERIPNYQASSLDYQVSSKSQISKIVNLQKALKHDSENLGQSVFSSTPKPRPHDFSARPLNLTSRNASPVRLATNLTPSNERFVSKAKYYQGSYVPDPVLTDRTNYPSTKEETPMGPSVKLAPMTNPKKIFKSKPQEEAQFNIPQSSTELKKPVQQDQYDLKSSRKPTICDKKGLKINTLNTKQKNVSPLHYEKTSQDKKDPPKAATTLKLDLTKAGVKSNDRPQTPPKDDDKDSPCHYEDSPPVKINPVRAIQSKKKPYNEENEAHQKRMSEYVSQTSMTSVTSMGSIDNKENLFGENYRRHGQIFPTTSHSGVYNGGVGTSNRKLDGIVEPKKIGGGNHYQNNRILPYGMIEDKLLHFKSSKNSLTDMKIFKEVLCFLSVPNLCQMTRVCKKFRSDEYISLLKKAQCRLIIKGLSQQDQYAFWDFHLNFGFLHKTYPLQYSMNANKVCNFERDILSDLDRTRSFNQVIPARQNSLLKVLIALSNAIPKVGYVQGLNSIAAVFLAHNITDSEAYWIMKYIFKKKHFDDAMVDNFAKVQLLTYQLEIYMRNYLPEIIDHLGENGINVSYFATQWFITMFSYDFELSHLTKIWNLFFIKGWKMIIRVALSLLWHFQDEICRKDCDDLPSFLKSFVSERISEVNEEDLFKVGFSFKVSNRLLKSLETLYDHSAPINIILVSNAEHKLEWKILPDDCSILNASTASQKDIMEYLNEDLDRMRNMNRRRGDLHHELDSYRSVNSSSINGSIILGDMSIDMKSSITSLHGNQSMRKSTDSSFIQTISNFGRKLRQILTPKENHHDTSFNRCKIKNAKMLDFNNTRDMMDHCAPYTDRSANQSHNMSSQKSHKLIVSTDIKGTTPFKKSIINGLRESHDKLGINMFDPLKDRENNRLFMQGSNKTTSASTNDLFDQVDGDMNYFLDSQLKSSFSSNQEILKELKRSQILCLDQVLDERYEEERLSVGRFKDPTPKNFEEMSRSFHVPNDRRASLNGSFTTATEHLRNGERLRVKTSERTVQYGIDKEREKEFGRVKRYGNESRMTIPEVANY